MIAAFVDAQLVRGAHAGQRFVERAAILGIDQPVGTAVLEQQRRQVTGVGEAQPDPRPRSRVDSGRLSNRRRPACLAGANRYCNIASTART